ncbi:sulfatase-like hydrolase/transferase [Spirosoma sp. HMF4905]|uniref:Sulfatase-like hydrolase/transferase n=1 Tax=Spirosoma arboris TaxID=2682092 RepID=A0A7K1S6A2_9BACT|nr:arylsulfatase [Spirosoma arboris]MVM29324.1 sulfatase-like hydrolase/transferase [Spirosoma arboris]
MKKTPLLITKFSLAALALLATTASTRAQYTPVQPSKATIGKTVAETQQWWPERKKAPQGAPNVVWILLDDIGFGAISSFGGLIQTPTLDSLAYNGLRYTNFHTTSICAPTRAALLTGRNHHSAHMGLFPENAVGTPGYDAQIPFEKATIAEILKENGYNTFALGKWHITPLADLTPAGPFNRWPTGRGFDHFFGFPSRGSTDQWHTEFWEDTRRIKDQQNGKHFNQVLADKAIEYVSEQKSAAPDKPFFLYLATGAGHAPHQVAKEWSDKYKGKFDAGWDAYREQTLANQIRLGVVPKNTVLPPRNPGIKAWNTLSEPEKKLYARFMEVYAGFLSYTDHEIGRVVNHLKQIGQLDNTLIFVSVGDNGASKEGTFVGTVNNFDPEISDEEHLKKNLKEIDLIGTEFAKANYPLGWAAATNVPFRQWKTDANSEGGTRNPLIVFYPKGIKEKGAFRTQYGHVIDILPTTVELINAQIPQTINGYKQDAVEGTSLAYSINDANASNRHTQQYYEILGTRSIYKDGWKAGTLHVKKQPFDQDKWELFNMNEDFNELHDLAASNPEKLKELRELFESEAVKYNIYPLKDGTPPTVGPSAYKNLNQVVLYPGIQTLIDIASPLAGKQAFTITADVMIPANGAEGVLLSRGGRAGGLTLFVQDKKLQFVYNLGDGTKYAVWSKGVLPVGKALLRVDVHFDAQKKAGQIDLYVNGTQEAKTTFERSIASIYSHEGVNVGFDDLTPVSDSYKVPFAFTGKINKVTLDFEPSQQSYLKK